MLRANKKTIIWFFGFLVFFYFFLLYFSSFFLFMLPRILRQGKLRVGRHAQSGKEYNRWD